MVAKKMPAKKMPEPGKGGKSMTTGRALKAAMANAVDPTKYLSNKQSAKPGLGPVAAKKAKDLIKKKK